MERKLLLVFALTFVVIMLFQPLLKKYGPQPPAKPESSQPTPNQAQVPSTNSVTSGTQVSDGATVLRPSGRTNASAATQPTQQATSEAETVIENDVYRIVFTNRGGQVKSWMLKKYTDDKGGQLELVNSAAAEKYGYPLSLWIYDETLRNKLNSVLYVTSAPASGAEGGRAGTLVAPAEVKFVYDDGDVSVQKNFKFDRSSYVVEVSASVTQKNSPVTAFPMWPSGFGSDMTAPQYATGQIIYQFDDKVERLAIKKISNGATLQGPFNWAGISDQYFAAVF